MSGEPKGRILAKAIRSLIQGLWKILLITLYAIVKFLHTIFGFFAKLLEKLI